MGEGAEMKLEFGDELSSKDIENLLFWAMWDAREKFGKERVNREADFEFHKIDKTLTFPATLNEVNEFIRARVERQK